MDAFFSLVAGSTEDEIIDAFATNYGWTPKDLEDLDVLLIFKLLKRIREAESTEILRRMWIAYLPLMATGVIRQVSFDEYKAKSMAGKVDYRSNAEILAEVEQVRKELRGE